MGISQFELLIISFEEKNHSLESSKTIEEIISVKQHLTLKWQFGTLKENTTL